MTATIRSMFSKIKLSQSDRPLVLAGFAAIALAIMVQYIAPVFINALVLELGFTPTQAGLIISAEMGGIAIFGFFVSPQLANVSKRTVAIIAAALTIIAQLASIFLTSFETLLIARCFAGAGLGALYACGAAATSMSSMPERFFALITAAIALFMALFVVVLGYSTTTYGLNGGYGVMAVVTVFSLLLLRLMPTEISAESKDHHHVRMPNKGTGFLLMLGIFPLMVTGSGVITFLVVLGVNIGYSAEEVSVILGMTYIFAIGASVFVAWMGVRYGYAGPLFVGMFIYAIAGWYLCTAQQQWIYVAANFAKTFGIFLITPFIFGVAAKLDKWGRWTAVIAATTTAGGTLGPTLAGVIMQYGSSRVLGYAVAIGSITSLVVTQLAVRQIARIKDEDSAERCQTASSLT